MKPKNEHVKDIKMNYCELNLKISINVQNMFCSRILNVLCLRSSDFCTSTFSIN